jgi:hypothetical protein
MPNDSLMKHGPRLAENLVAALGYNIMVRTGLMMCFISASNTYEARTGKKIPEKE